VCAAALGGIANSNLTQTMKKIFLAAILALFFSSVHAQSVDSRAVAYSVRYEKEHLFLQKDSDFNVVDYDIEWPEVLGYSYAPELKSCISASLTGTSYLSFDSLRTKIYADYGVPVTGMLKTIPDDRRFCYVTASARIVGYSPNHWIAYSLSLNVAPGKLSSIPATSGERVVVYDIPNGKMFNARDLISDNVVERNEPQDFYDNLFAPLDDDFFNTMQSCEIEGVWIDEGNIDLLVKASTAESTRVYTAAMPLATYAYTLSRQGRKLFTKEGKTISPTVITQPQIIDGDSIYNNVEVNPTFKGGDEALKQYMSYTTKPDVILNGPVKEYTSFVVDKDGKIKDVCILRPIHPILDRHAAMTVKGMPNFIPGRQNGKPVSVRMYMPINYRP
jgi:hypothetical protein